MNQSEESLYRKLFNQMPSRSIWFWTFAYSINFLYFIFLWQLKHFQISEIPLIPISIFICIIFVQIFSDPIETFPFEGTTLDVRRDIEDKRSQQRYIWMIFAYSFMLFSPAIIFYPLVSASNTQSVKEHSARLSTQPIAIFVGCSLDSENKHLSCFKPKLNAEGEQQLVLIGSWAVNIGGAIHLCEETGSTITCQVNEGLLIPLYSIIIALMGGSISLARRLPQIQKQVSVEFIATEQLPKITQFEFREQLILQIAQYTVAPFLAILAYYLVEPSNTTNSIVLAFMAGFSSETILRMVRSIADKIMPEMTMQQQFGNIVGVITFKDFPASGVKVFLSNSPHDQPSITNEQGLYLLANVPIGEHIINAECTTNVDGKMIEFVKKDAVNIEKNGQVRIKNMVIQ